MVYEWGGGYNLDMKYRNSMKTNPQIPFFQRNSNPRSLVSEMKRFISQYEFKLFVFFFFLKLLFTTFHKAT